MPEPISRNPAITQFLDALLGVDSTDRIRLGICVNCGGSAVEFNDDLSRKEFFISGFCQKCQDEVFGGDEE